MFTNFYLFSNNSAGDLFTFVFFILTSEIKIADIIITAPTAIFHVSFSLVNIILNTHPNNDSRHKIIDAKAGGAFLTPIF